MRDSPVFLERPRQVVPHSVPVAAAPVTPSQSTFGPKYGQDPVREQMPDKGRNQEEPVVTGGPGSTSATTPSNLNVASTVGGGTDAGVRTTGVLGTKQKMLPDTQIAADAAAGGGTNPLTPIMNLATREVQTPFGSYAMWVLAVVAFIAWRVVKKVF